MNHKILPVAAMLLLFGLTSTRAADEKIKESPYYPLKVGTKWHYKAGGNPIVIQVAKHEKVGDVMCALLETSKEGQVVASEHITIKDDGVYRVTIRLPYLTAPT